MNISIRWAQARAGQKMHIVPELGGDTVANVALCGKHVSRWRMTCNLPLGYACKNCRRVNQLNGRNRALAIVRAVWNAERAP